VVLVILRSQGAKNEKRARKDAFNKVMSGKISLCRDRVRHIAGPYPKERKSKCLG
jgi:hypothetical protein